MEISNSYPSPKILGIVGIRSGSVGVPNKNIRPIFGKPLIGWILEKAKNSKYINKIVISTDSLKYADIAKSFGAEVPCMRPNSLAKKDSPEIDFIKYTLKYLKENQNYIPDIVVRMMATVPLQSTDDIDSVIEILLKDKYAESAVVIAEARQHPLKALKIIPDGYGGEKLVTYFSESGREVTPVARQNYKKAFFRGNVIASRLSVISEKNSLTGDLVRYHTIPQERAIDIDNEVDFLTVENLMRNKEKYSENL